MMAKTKNRWKIVVIVLSAVMILLYIAFYKLFSLYQKTNRTPSVYENQDFYDVEMYDYAKLDFKDSPKNIILMIGDGMGVSQVFSGITANKGKLHITNMKYIGFSQTQSASNFVTESAAGGTAIACGKRTKNGVIGVDIDNKPMKSILEIAEELGKATGLVATSSITHATPASFIAHQPNRNMHEEIAADFLKTDIEVIIGGGRKYFTDREDNRNLLKELEDKGHRVFNNIKDAENIDTEKLTILTAEGHNPHYDKRGNMLVDATQKSIEVLSNNDEGFFLMIEGSQIDWAGHDNSASNLIGEVLDFDKAVGRALEFAVENKETLVIVVADHETGGVSVIGSDMEIGKVQVDFSTTNHTGVMVPVFAFGPCAENFIGIYNNVDIFHKILDIYKKIEQ